MKFWDSLRDKSDISSARIAFFWLIFNGTLMGWFILIFGTENSTEAATVMGILTSIASGLKIYQKKQEIKADA